MAEPFMCESTPIDGIEPSSGDEEKKLMTRTKKIRPVAGCEFPGWKVVGEVKKVGKSRNFCSKVGKSRNFSAIKVGKSRNFITIFITFLYVGTSNMFVSIVNFEGNHLFF